MTEVLEAVPNFSEGRDPLVVRALLDVIRDEGVDVLDFSSDPDHHRSVITYIGEPAAVEAASVAAARAAMELIDLNEHAGVHPRIGALDVLPFVPLRGIDMDAARDSAHRAGRAIADMGIPVYFYGYAADPPGRGLAAIRRGGFEGLSAGFPPDRPPDLPVGARRPHPTAGAACVGARDILLAWNVFVSGIDVQGARAIAAAIRERGGGFPGLRALGLALPEQGRVQISMNLEDPSGTAPLAVFEAIERLVAARGGQVEGTQVIGMMPDTLVFPGVADRLQLLDLGPARVLSNRVAEHVRARARGRSEISDIAE